MKNLKKTVIGLMGIVVMALVASPAGAAITNGGFESGMTDWTPEYTQDGSNQGYSNELYVTPDYHHSGENALWGRSYIHGDTSNWWESDWCNTYAWSEEQDLSAVTSIQLYLTDFQSNGSHAGWGWGQEIYLVLRDNNANETMSILVENHEQPFLSLVDRGLYSISAGNDGRDWYQFDVELNDTYFGSDPSASLDLSHTKVGICWEAVSWYNFPQELWAGGAVDDICLIPEPATLGVLLAGGLAMLRPRRK